MERIPAYAENEITGEQHLVGCADFEENGKYIGNQKLCHECDLDVCPFKIGVQVGA